MTKIEATTLLATCEALTRKSWDERNEIEPNPDISGPGVLAGFLGSAGLMMLMTTSYYFIAFDPRRDLFQSRKKGTTAGSQLWETNSVDKYIFNLMTPLRVWLARILGIGSSPQHRKKLEDIFIACVSTFSDVQTLTGIGILVSAYGSLSTGISVYHWQYAVYLAWYANLTQQSGLALLRGHLNEPHNQTQRLIRLVAMGLLAALLVAAMVPTAYFDWSSLTINLLQKRPGAFGDYAWCFVDIATANRMLELFRPEVLRTPYLWTIYPAMMEPTSGVRDLKSFENMVLSVVLLFSTFATKLLKGSMRVSDFASNQIRRRVRIWIHIRIKRASGQDLHTLLESKLDKDARLSAFLKQGLLTRPLLALYLTGHVYAEFVTSTMFEIFWLWLSTLFLTLELVVLRTSREPWSTSGLFSFGQVLPVMLLAAPVFVITMETISANNDRENGYLSPLRQPSTSVTHVVVHWKPGDQLPTAGLRWSMLLLILQVPFAFSVTLYMCLMSNVGPSIWLKFLIPWYCITLPSAVYFMVVLGIERRRFKRILIPIFLFLISYTTSLFWVKFTAGYNWSDHGVSYFYLLSKNDNSWDGSDLYEIAVLNLAASGLLVGLYIIYVLVAALSRKIFRRRGNGNTPCGSAVQQMQGEMA